MYRETLRPVVFEAMRDLVDQIRESDYGKRSKRNEIDIYETSSDVSLSDSNLLGARVTENGTVVDTKLERFYNIANSSSVMAAAKEDLWWRHWVSITFGYLQKSLVGSEAFFYTGVMSRAAMIAGMIAEDSSAEYNVIHENLTLYKYLLKKSGPLHLKRIEVIDYFLTLFIRPLGRVRW